MKNQYAQSDPEGLFRCCAGLEGKDFKGKENENCGRCRGFKGGG